MRDITERLNASAEWVDRNSIYHFKEDQNYDARRMSSDAVTNMREASELIEALRSEVKIMKMRFTNARSLSRR